MEVNHEWMMVHTNSLKDGTHSDSHLPELPESKEPPKDVLPPELPEFKPPSTDVAIWTTESEMYEALATIYQIQRRYGYIDFEGAEVNIFTEDGTEFLSQKCLKICIEHHDVLGKMKGWLYLPGLSIFKQLKYRKKDIYNYYLELQISRVLLSFQYQ